MGPELLEQVEALASFAGAFASTESDVDREDELVRKMGRDGRVHQESAAPATRDPERGAIGTQS